jgi:23S rRNA (adenine2030-N6)-methyltransferase
LLSYQHAYHAGNFADLIKHVVLVEILEHLVKKNKPFDYIDTHAGAGLYDLHSTEASKLAEYEQGIGKLKAQQWPQLCAYFNAIAAVNRGQGMRYYPGSPMLASQYLRAGDKAWLYELHPRDFTLLQKRFDSERQVKVYCQDGLQGVLAKVPPLSRRGLVLIDPSYELKSEYEKVFVTVHKAWQKFATGIYAIWYPVVDRRIINKLESNFINSGIKNIQRFELAVAADADASGMTASGMIVINPPWGLYKKMQQVLPALAAAVAADNKGFSRCDTLVGE